MALPEHSLALDFSAGKYRSGLALLHAMPSPKPGQLVSRQRTFANSGRKCMCPTASSATGIAGRPLGTMDHDTALLHAPRPQGPKPCPQRFLPMQVGLLQVVDDAWKAQARPAWNIQDSKSARHRERERERERENNPKKEKEESLDFARPPGRPPPSWGGAMRAERVRERREQERIKWSSS